MTLTLFGLNDSSLYLVLTYHQYKFTYFNAILEVSETATTQQIRDAYKRAALKTHPDRVASTSPDRAERTRKFQLVNDAYYTLSDNNRRREYDAQRKLFNTSTPADPFEEDIPEGEEGRRPRAHTHGRGTSSPNRPAGPTRRTVSRRRMPSSATCLRR
ncbi:hypothetical protein NW754_012705 [Fusarium falciforme]|nr:hypothetical protein NW754_012705 [Fusarium falciforme]